MGGRNGRRGQTNEDDDEWRDDVDKVTMMNDGDEHKQLGNCDIRVSKRAYPSTRSHHFCC